jgi:2-oxo-3-hexenedioate decarboxylase
MTDLSALAQLVDNAALHANAIEQLSASGHALTLTEAYQVQALSIGRRLERGEKRIGIKMGFTSRAKMAQMGVDDLIWGPLTDAMMIEDGASISLDRYVHPRIEPEVVFRLGKPLSGDVTLEEALTSIEAIAPAMELIDSRYENFKFSLQDVVADNCSSSGVIIGQWQEPRADISGLDMELVFDGDVVQQGSSSDILGDPYQSLVEAARLAGEAGVILEAGWIVMAGGATAAEALRPSLNVTMNAQELGSVSVNITA